jgi:hypothetical protein
MATPDCISIGEASDFLTKDANRVSGRIARSLAINSPWINVIETGIFAAGVADTQRSIVQEAIAPALSQCNPQWASFQCSLPPQTVCYGSTEYQYTPEQYFEKSCPLCLQTSFSAFRNSIRMVEMSYTDHITTLWNSWIRAKILNLSSTKVVADSTATSFGQIVSNGFQTPFAAGRTPDSPLTFKFLKFIMNYLTHSLLAGAEFQWGNGANTYFRLITDQQTIDNFRSDDSVRNDLRWIAAGDSSEKKNLLQYSWMGPYQGVQFGVDQSIIRVSGIRDDGTVCCVEPFASADASQGTKRVVNEDWLNAPYQISFLLAKNSFFREIPEEYLGEGMTKFERQNWGGKLTWHNVLDNCDNITGNKGFHYWQLASAFRPERPEFAIPILHTRCVDDMGLVSCSAQGYYTSCV